MKDEHTNGKKMARNGCNTVIYKGTFVSNHSLGQNVSELEFGETNHGLYGNQEICAGTAVQKPPARISISSLV